MVMKMMMKMMKMVMMMVVLMAELAMVMVVGKLNYNHLMLGLVVGRLLSLSPTFFQYSQNTCAPDVVPPLFGCQ
jgi:hypothetical protein